MPELSLRYIIDIHDLQIEDIRKACFPSMPADKFAEIVTNQRELSATELHRVASYLGTSMDGLYSGLWSVSYRDDVYTFNKKKHLAILDTKTFKLSLYRDKSLLFEDIIVAKHISVFELTKLLTKRSNKL